MFTGDQKKVSPTFMEKALILYELHELDGRDLRISVGEDVVDGQRTMVAVGTDSVDGMQYVLGVYITEEEGKNEDVLEEHIPHLW